MGCSSSIWIDATMKLLDGEYKEGDAGASRLFLKRGGGDGAWMKRLG